jgi:hypothetical protein
LKAFSDAPMRVPAAQSTTRSAARRRASSGSRVSRSGVSRDEPGAEREHLDAAS